MLTASLRDMMAGVEHARAGEGGLLLTDAVRVFACTGSRVVLLKKNGLPRGVVSSQRTKGCALIKEMAEK
jgi:hypothetical protein